ncbi:MAG: Protein GrpE [Chlamydiales bacterium]|nr:Protein GrpE [Chlamydiales bacterium]
MSEEEENPTEIDEVEQLKESLKEAQDKYLRVLAESENARKRMQKERQDTMKYAIEGILVEFLHPLDNLEKALHFAESMSDEVRTWAVGFEMLLNQFKQILNNHGVEEYHSVGKVFDPHLHEAVEMVETTDYAPGVVVEELVRGYKMGERPIRVARVNVAKAPGENNSEEKQEG